MHTLTPTLYQDIITITPPIPPISVAPLANSPLEGISFSELPLIISNPYEQPQIGKDDAHHGVDFAFYQYKEFPGIAGLPIQSIFNGKIAGVTQDLPPYGYMTIIEADLPQPISDYLKLPKKVFPSPDWVISPQLTCPELPPTPQNLVDQSFSLYVLYAHLSLPTTLKVGETVNSGAVLGYVGNSGMSGNPHLHLEFRIGPSDYKFEPMGHYRGDLSQSEIMNYCIWRVSGWFIPFDPMLFLNSLNSSAIQD